MRKAELREKAVSAYIYLCGVCIRIVVSKILTNVRFVINSVHLCSCVNKRIAISILMIWCGLTVHIDTLTLSVKK